MSQLLQKTAALIYKHFAFFWMLVTLGLLLSALYINWQMSLDKFSRDISVVSDKLSNNVDRFIEDIFQAVYTLPVYEKNLVTCNEGLYPHLERISLNYPGIAGLTISSKSKLLCSTLENTDGLTFVDNTARTISGPFNLPVFEQPLYLIQQKIGDYNIGILILSSTIKNILLTSDPRSDTVILYNSSEKKSILRIDRSSDRSSWLFNPDLESLSITSHKTITGLSKLYSVDGAMVVVFENPAAIYYDLMYREFVVGLIILIVSAMLYFLVQNLINKRYSLLGAIKLAIKNNEFYPAYQPLFDKKIGAYSGVEVLLRWQDNQDKIIMPDFFIEEAENTGLIIPITLQIIETAFKETKKIISAHPDFHLAFNITALHFTDPQFFTKFNLLKERYNISPHQIIFEITERDLLDKNNDTFIDKMRELRQRGFSLAVDDYGTGHASISYLHSFPFNYLKIDKIFIQAIGTKAITESLNDAIISMAKRLNLIIIAEGVETEEQVKYLSENEVRFLQGWYFSKAISIEKLTELLKGEQNESLH